MSHTRLSSAPLTKNCPARTRPPPMIELTIDSTAFATTPIPLSEPCRVVATHAGRKQFDCQGSESSRFWLPASPTSSAPIPWRARSAYERVSRALPGMRREQYRSIRRAGSWPVRFEKTQDQKSWFLAQLLVVLRIAFTHCFGWDRLDESSDEESSIGGSRTQSRQRLPPKAHRLVPGRGMPDVGFQGGLEIGTAFAQPVHHRVLRRYHRRPARAQDAAELGEGGCAVAGVVNGQRADDEVEGAIGVGQRLPQRRLVDPYPACRALPGQAHHDRARIKGGDLGPSHQQFAQVQAGAAGCVQNPPAGDRSQRGQHRWPVVMSVVRAVRGVLLKAQAHLVVGIPQVLTHADTMTHAGDPGRPSQHGRSFFHRAVEQGLAVAAAGRGRSAGRSLPLKENHDLRGADGPHTRHREAADDPPALGRIAVERVLQALWTELAAPPAVFLRQHLIFHGLSTSLKRPANGDFYGIPTRTRANVKHQMRVVRPCIIRSRGYPPNDSDASKCCSS